MKNSKNPAANSHFEQALDELWQLAVLAGADEAEMAKVSRALTRILDQRASRDSMIGNS